MLASVAANLVTLAFAVVIVQVTVVCCAFSASVLTLERVIPANQRVELDELKARDRARHARILQGVAGGVADFTVFGYSDQYLGGLYFTRVKLGSPPREFNVQIDTGSDILWVTCNSCSNCPQSSELGIELNFFDIANSSTASQVSCSDPLCTFLVQTTAAGCSPHSNQCNYSIQYKDGSGTSGYYVYDMLYLDMVGNSLTANSSASIVFGCSTYQSGDLTRTEKATDGIFGFGRWDLSVISQLSSQGITPKVFSHCLKGEGSGGGILVLGEILEPSIVYSPLVPSQSHYNLILQSIAVKGQLLPIDQAVFGTASNQETMVDSGTTLAYLVEEVYNPFVSAITAAVSQSVTSILSKGNQCYQVSTSITDIFPPVSLNFAGGASMVLKPEDYLVNVGLIDGAIWCIGFQKVQEQGVTILGDLVLKDKIFVYDLANQRIGWANYDCSLSVNVSVIYSRDEVINAGQPSLGISSRNILFELIPLCTTALLLHVLAFSGFIDS